MAYLHTEKGLSAIRVENEFVSRKALAAGREKEPAASALRLRRHRNQHEWRRARKSSYAIGETVLQVRETVLQARETVLQAREIIR